MASFGSCGQGPYTTCYNRFVRWRRAGVWDRIIDAVSAANDAAVQSPRPSMPVIAVGLITDYEQAEAIIGTGPRRTGPRHALRPTLALACGRLFRRPRQAPNQYLRSQPRQHRNLFDV